MPRRLAQLAIALPLIVAVSGPWAVLQSVAWIGMVISYSQDATIPEAISMTFDGEHPCKMCKVVKEGRKAEQEQPAVLKTQNKIEFFLEVRPVIVFAPCGPTDAVEHLSQASPRRDPPLLRPPIFA
ncbi:MAG: hypothetical protein IPK15_07300 [Verrucomicrobia bacterium]|nr:hypothetical protein [Verrucomicrobiota bacterium]